jgi:hypothetical protein
MKRLSSTGNLEQKTRLALALGEIRRGLRKAEGAKRANMKEGERFVGNVIPLCKRFWLPLVQRNPCERVSELRSAASALLRGSNRC